ncbi:fumarylacetoacetate hydrolase family protein [Corallococcus sp. AS-1-12]|uniref:fumarylacetoacetate hydrolase family protein n=1 Tax=Corallococcus sp. AS-1-12 TaxID=2874598 RepID=UPI001CBF7665|nr:fumarylacetoacetate hydrolase family protein [Corallococcus sp. AS-1-12]MBZ4329214.1 fumarylacetoacetate hydrolase family protein [Corallococcus sp. AS-1-12]
MIVHVVRYQHEDKVHWGVVRGGSVTPVPGDFPTTGDFVRSVSLPQLAALDGTSIDLATVKVLSPVTHNQQFVCQGANYRQHMVESGVDPDTKTFNMIFTKASSCIVPADSDVVRPTRVRFLDYEIELGLVLRRDITQPQEITDQNLHDFIAGAVIVNDYSARDVQIPEMQFYKGKSFRTFGPVGPQLALFDAEDTHLLRKLTLRLKVNGKVRQQDTTANLVHGPAATLTELSGVHDFRAGDLLATGTPAGCALSVPSPMKQRMAALVPEKARWKLFLAMQAKRTQYLQPGDVVEASIRSDDGRLDLGVQRNLIIAER